MKTMKSKTRQVVETIAAQGEMDLRSVREPQAIMTAALDGYEEPGRWSPSAGHPGKSQMDVEKEELIGRYPRAAQLISTLYDDVINNMAIAVDPGEMEDAEAEGLDVEAEVQQYYAQGQQLIQQIMGIIGVSPETALKVAGSTWGADDYAQRKMNKRR